jgi:CRP/FNR family cyclic AMP-dependent transcriptional regulator
VKKVVPFPKAHEKSLFGSKAVIRQLHFNASEYLRTWIGVKPNKLHVCSSYVHFAKDETVIMEGSGGAAFFLIESGNAMVSKKGVQVAMLGPGDCFGELALIDGGPRSATVTAVTDLVCYGLTFWEFRPLIERNSSIAWKLLQALAKRLRDADSASAQR